MCEPSSFVRGAGHPGRGGSRPGQLTRRPPERLRGLAGLEGLRDNRRLPNKRLKLAAPGLGRIPFVRQRTSMLVCELWSARDVGRRSLSAVR